MSCGFVCLRFIIFRKGVFPPVIRGPLWLSPTSVNSFSLFCADRGRWGSILSLLRRSWQMGIGCIAGDSLTTTVQPSAMDLWLLLLTSPPYEVATPVPPAVKRSQLPYLLQSRRQASVLVAHQQGSNPHAGCSAPFSISP
jgi:hypothetical protein